MSLLRHDAYKAVDHPYLSEIPSHWELRRLKHLAEVFPSNVDKKSYEGQTTIRLCNYTDVYYNERITAGMDLMPATATAEQIERFTLRTDDVVITKDSETADDIAVAAHVPEDLPGVVCGYHLAMVRPRPGFSGAFAKRFFDSQLAKAQFCVSANGLTRVGLGQYELDNALVPAPPMEEQLEIAEFLDRETARIDTLVAEQRRLMELLQEKRQGVISHAVTKGLNPDAPMKPSGVEWLGEVPAHWTIAPLKRIADVRTGVAKGKDNGTRDTIAVPYLRVANVQDGYLDLQDVATIEIPKDDLQRYALRVGDVLMNEGGDFDKLGRGHIWHGAIEPCITQNHVFAVRPHGVSPEWLNAVTGSSYAQFYFMTRSKQSTNLASISSTNLMELPVVLPPDDEQRTILESVHDKTRDTDALLSEAGSAISLLSERRTALISAAVTGQIDVRQFAAAEAA